MIKNLSTTESITNLSHILVLHAFFFSISFYLINNYTFFVSIPIFLVISFIHQKFLGEFIHEGCHFHLFNSRKLNDFISNYLVGLFFFVSVQNYRKKHFEHHKHEEFFKETDPETAPIKVFTKKEFWKKVFLDLIGVNGIKFLLRYTNHEEDAGKFKTDYNFYLILTLQMSFLIMIFQTKFLIFYIIYYFSLGTLYHLQLRLRVLGQHLYLENNKPIQYEKTTSRTIKGNILEKLFFTSDIAAYHDLHHLHPYYPYRKLREIFKKESMSSNNDENIYSTSRFKFMKKFYESLN